ncbi:MAG: tRNA (adenosine(37)-N6)-threonylcarbamoyltransferase complex dimerization subunit type 1 TsaB [Gemmatimonadetes bacterium]|nr:tRNA (adenosine(37)-N6)-threonylcarbamoyltransferase complex dimerization subunit type 1 TsaB [Gemmatimonadota bacterium]
MIRVAIETSTPFGTVAVARDGDLLAEVGLGVQRRHAEMTLPALEQALAEAGVDRGAIDEVVVGAGPGSFTGVRVAGATAKGLATALGVPLRAFSSLLALAAGVASGGAVCALLDARRGEVYAGCWRIGDGAPAEILAPIVGPVEDVIRDTTTSSPVFAGEGADRYRDVLTRAGGRVMTGPVHPRASTLLRLAALDPGSGRVPEPSSWEPLYVRASSAERGVAG